MRIMVISDLYPPVSFGGYELECHAVVEHLRRTHVVQVLTSDRGPAPAEEEPEVARLLPYSGAGGMTALRSPLDALRAVDVTRAMLGRFRPDLVFVWSAIAVPTAAVRIAVDHGAPVVHRLCEHWFAANGVLGDHFMRRLASPRRGLAAPSVALARLANRHPRLRLDVRTPYRAALSWNSEALRASTGSPPLVRPLLERVLHPATANTARFAVLERRPSSRRTVLFVGRASQQKGAGAAVEALGELQRSHGLSADLVFAGPYEDRARDCLQAAFQASGAQGEVHFRGKLATEALGRELQAAHVLLAPSAAEAFGMACVEAAAARVPVVASRVGGIPEALREGEHALLFALGDVPACADALARVLTQEDGTAARVERAHVRARQLSLEAYLEATDAFLDDAVTAFGRAARA